MKKVFVILLLALCSFAPSVVKAQVVDTTTLAFEVVDTASGTADELFIKAMEWVATTYKSTKDVVQMGDKASGKIVGKGYSSVVPPQHKQSAINTLAGVPQRVISFGVSYTFTLDVRDRRYRYRVNNFQATEYSGMFGATPVSLDLDLLKPETLKGKSQAVKNLLRQKQEDIAFVKAATETNAKALMESLKEAMHKPADTF